VVEHRAPFLARRALPPIAEGEGAERKGADVQPGNGDVLYDDSGRAGSRVGFGGPGWPEREGRGEGCSGDTFRRDVSKRCGEGSLSDAILMSGSWGESMVGRAYIPCS